MAVRFHHTTANDWAELAAAAVATEGYAVIEGVLPADFLAECRTALYRVQAAIHADIGRERLERARELGVLRLMMKYEPFFLQFLELPAMLAMIDRVVAPTAIMHLQNGFILPSFAADSQPSVFQNSYHQDFPRLLNGYVASVNVFFAIDEFRLENGATWVVPRTHQQPRPDEAVITRDAVPLTCAAGSMIVFDSTLWHAAGANTSGADRLAINHQFTRSYIKQQVDYVRALGDDVVCALPEQSQQLLGWYTRVVTSLDEYYQPADRRRYRPGQG